MTHPTPTATIDTNSGASLRDLAFAASAVASPVSDLIPRALFDAIGRLVSTLAWGPDFPDDRTTIEVITEAVNELYACLEDGAFGPIGPLLASGEAVEWAEAQRQADLKGIAR